VTLFHTHTKALFEVIQLGFRQVDFSNGGLGPIAEVEYSSPKA
jgi:hypothetical protein